MQSMSATALAVAAGLTGLAASPLAAAELPAIKASLTNATPACATPGRMQAFLKSRNAALDARFDTIAVDYMRHGEALGVRWDYAFFQMIMETGQLSFKNGSRSGDVKPQQNNFAGLGATGGVPGESFPDVSTGVRAHLEHVLLYAGEAVAAPVAERTRKVQQWGVLTAWQKGISHPITYAELASQWAPKSKSYVDSLEQIAAKFMDDVCKQPDPHPEFIAAARGQANQPAQLADAAPAAQSPAKISGAELARKAITEGTDGRSALGSTAAAGPLAAVLKLLNGPAGEPAAPSDPLAAAQPDPAAATAALVAPTPPAVLPQAAAALGTKSQRATAGPTTPPPTKTAAVGAAPKAMVPAAEPIATATPAPAGAPTCRVWTASYGGQRAVIVKSIIDSVANFTVLDVNEGQEGREAEAFIAAYAKGGAIAGEFTNQDKALEKAFELCPEG